MIKKKIKKIFVVSDRAVFRFCRSGRTSGRLHGLHGRSAPVPSRGRRVSRRTPRGPRAPQPPGSVPAKAHGPGAHVAGLKLNTVAATTNSVAFKTLTKKKKTKHDCC